jgi:hypothetical protein
VILPDVRDLGWLLHAAMGSAGDRLRVRNIRS